jgi:hypothetical protein
MAALVVPCEVRRADGKTAPGFGVQFFFPRGVRAAPPASICTVTDGDICGEKDLSVANNAAISCFSTTIPGHSYGWVGMTGVPYRDSRSCLIMASARKDPDKRFPGKANGGHGNSSPAAVLTFMAKGACS